MTDDITRLPLTPEGHYQLDVLLFKLHKHQNAGAQAYLINKLYEVPLEKVMPYLPQLLNISIQRPNCECYETFFYDAALKDHNIALKLYWLLQATIEDVLPEFLTKVEKMLHLLESIIVTGQKNNSNSSFQPPHLYPMELNTEDVETHLRKRIRADYFNEQHKFAYTLVKVASALLDEEEDTETILKAYIQNIDTWIKGLRCWYNSKQNSLHTKRLFRGLILPLNFFEPSNYIEQIVRIPSENVKCFKTKARVPYLVIFETIDINEEEPNRENQTSLILPPEEILDKTLVDKNPNEEVADKNSIRFKDYKEFIERCENSELSDASNNTSFAFESSGNPWAPTWAEICQNTRAESPFGHYKSWKARGVIVKCHDDLRQEFLAMQIIKKAKDIFKKEYVNVFLRPYDILIISHNSGMIEFVPDAVSLHSIKKNASNFTTLLEFFGKTWSFNFEEAQKNFAESMAGYSLICYILNLKDRHNGNILLDNKGHIIHIDFGFFLSSSPGGNMNFEAAPFKLTKEMIDVMGGYQSEIFLYFKILLYQGIIALRKNYSELLLIIEMMRPGKHLPCFYNSDLAIKEFKKRFFLDKGDDECMQCVNELIDNAAENWRTIQYDNYQMRSNKILY